MKETNTKQTAMIDTLTNLIQTQNTTFTNTFNRQQVTITSLQTELEHVKKSQYIRLDMVMALGDDHFKMLDEKLDILAFANRTQTNEVKSQAEAHVNEIMMDEKAYGVIADMMAERVLEKNVELANGKKTKAPIATKDDGDLPDDELLPNQDPSDPEGGARSRETKGEDPKTQSLKADGAQADRKQEIIEIEES